VSLPNPEPAGSHRVTERRNPDPLAPPANTLTTVAPYHPPPAFPPPRVGRAAPTDGRAITSLAASILGILFGLPFGVPGLTLGPLGYFMGRSSIERIDSATGTLAGRSLAVAGSVLGVVATAIGALVSLAWLVLLLFVISAPPTLG
jgi:hypothetical protein